MDNKVMLQIQLDLHTRASGLFTCTGTGAGTGTGIPLISNKGGQTWKMHSQHEPEVCTTSSTTQACLAEMFRGISTKIHEQ